MSVEIVPEYLVKLTEQEMVFIYFALGAAVATAGVTDRNTTLANNIMTELQRAKTQGPK